MNKPITLHTAVESSRWELDVAKLAVPIFDEETQQGWMAIIINAQTRQFEIKLFPRNPNGVELSDWLMEHGQMLTGSARVMTDNGAGMNSKAVRKVLAELGIELYRSGLQNLDTTHAAERLARKINDALSELARPVTRAEFDKLIDSLRGSLDRSEPHSA